MILNVVVIEGVLCGSGRVRVRGALHWCVLLAVATQCTVVVAQSLADQRRDYAEAVQAIETAANGRRMKNCARRWMITPWLFIWITSN